MNKLGIDFKVGVRCYTYNHSKYIESAMDGFTMQKTSFPYICTVVDDASTDGTQDVIKSYLSAHFNTIESGETEDYFSFLASHKANTSCFFLVLLLKYNHYQLRKPKGPYFTSWMDTAFRAICEGDDYWIDGDKLQKQVDFLEAHPQLSSCIHAFIREDSKGRKETIHKYSSDVDFILPEDVFNSSGMFGATGSWLYRASAVNDYPQWAASGPVGDRPLKMVLFARGGIGYLNDVMSVYRLGIAGSWTERMSFDLKYRLRTHRGILDISRKFDEWTDRKYHKYVARSIRRQRRKYIVIDSIAIVKAFLCLLGIKIKK